MVDGLSPYLHDLVAKVAPIEARLAVLDLEIATREQERDGLRATLAGISRALDPAQITLPLAGLGSTVEKPKPCKLTAKGEELLRAALANESLEVKIPRSIYGRGMLLAANALSSSDSPLMKHIGSLADGTRIYRITPEGELVARALPVIAGPEGGAS